MASHITTSRNLPPQHLIVPGRSIPKPPTLGIVNLPPGPKTAAALPTPTDPRTCYVQNSKNGDVLNVLPFLYQKFSETGHPQVLCVSQEYVSALSGCSYIEPFVWAGDWTDLNGALKQAQAKFKTVVSLSTYGKQLTLAKQTPSFALEQWRLGGALDKFDTVPLVFDKRDRVREQALIDKYLTDEPFILFADHSQSSPFDQTDNLVQLLKGTFGTTHRILRLSEVHAEQIYDLLALYERAAVLVSIETMHLHLSQACGVPVIALVTNTPEMWHGTAWHQNFYLHCRYCDYESRKGEIIQAVADAIQLRDMPQIEVTGTGGYNLTTLAWNGKRVGVYRWHPKADSWRTELAAWTGEKTVRVAPPRGFDQQSIEDGRLFVHNGKLHLSYTVVNEKGCVIQYGELDTSGDSWRIINHFQPRYPGNDFTTLQKNWSFWSLDGKLYAAFQRSPRNIVLELDGDRMVNTLESQTPDWKWGQIRGGTCPIERNGLWLQFFHSQTRNNRSPWGWTYYMGALLMEMTPPFQIVAVSSFPIMAGTERYYPVARWKPRVIFPAGAIKQDGDYLVSLGVNDAATGKVLLTDSDLNL